MTDEEKVFLVEAATKKGVSLSGFVRQASLNKAEKVLGRKFDTTQEGTDT